MTEDNKPQKTASHDKKNKKLLVQVGLIVASVFVFVIAGAAAILVQGSLSTYFKAKEELFGGLMNKISIEAFSIGGAEWFFDFVEEHPGEIKAGTSDNIDAEKWNDRISEATGGDKENKEKAEQYINSLSYEEQLSYAQSMYSYMDEVIMIYRWFLPKEGIVLFDPKGEQRGFVFSGETIGKSIDNSSLGSYSDYDPEDHPALKKVLNGKTDMAFEQYKDKETGEYLYIGFKAIKFNGNLRCVLAIVHSWTDVHSDVMRMELLMVLLIGGVLMVLAVLLLHFLNRSVIKPLTRVKEGMREYIQNKDSAKIVEQMSMIRQKNELGALADDIAELAVEIDNYNDENVHLFKEKEKIATEMSLASRIQMDALPKKFPEHEAFEIYASMNPAKDVGGDFYDFFFIGDMKLGMVIADVSDKGVPAALFMMVAKRLLREYTTSGLDLEYVMYEANDSLCEGNENQMFVTAWLGVLDLKTGLVRAVSAGHEFPMLKLGSGKFEILKDKHGPALGAMEGVFYREYRFTLPKEGTLFVYTDGAPEATNAAGEMFGTGRMIRTLNEDPELTPEELARRMTKSINEFVGEAPQFDDLTMLCLKYKGMK